MINNFKCKETKKIFNEDFSKKFPVEIQERAFLKLMVLFSANSIEDLRIPLSNHLEALKGDRKGQHSIRINNKWRICFIFKNGNSTNVEITDYH